MAQRCRRRDAGTYYRPANRLALPSGHRLPIRCWEEEKRRLCFGGRTFEWSFLRADVSFSILGVDFLRANRLLVDIAANSLVDSSIGDQFSLTGQPSGYTASIILPANMATKGTLPRPREEANGPTGQASYASIAAAPRIHVSSTK